MANPARTFPRTARLVTGNPRFPGEGTIVLVEVGPDGGFVRYGGMSTGLVAIRRFTKTGQRARRRSWVSETQLYPAEM